jgi:signal transduction histidine kinase
MKTPHLIPLPSGERGRVRGDFQVKSIFDGQIYWSGYFQRKEGEEIMSKENNYKDYAVLFVDDEEDNLRIFKENMEEYFTIHTAISGTDGLDILEKHKNIAVVIADQRMPHMSGTEFLKSVKEKYPDIVRIILTAYAEFEIAIDAINEGNIYKYILKPWDVRLLSVDIMRAIDQYILKEEKDRLYEEKIRTIKKMARANRLAAIGILASGISHEIKNQFVPIKTFIQTFSEMKDDEYYSRRLHSLAEEDMHNIEKLLNKLMIFSRSSSPHFEYKNIHDILDDLILMIEGERKKGRIKMVKNFTDNLPKVFMDKEKISQLFLNLILNAIQVMTEDGTGGTLKIETHFLPSMEEKNNCIQVIVEDTGKGISGENKDKIFDLFFTTKEPGKGTGLGLSIAHHIVDEHRGSIDVESEVGKGTRFYVTLPVNPINFDRRVKDEIRKIDDPLNG